MQFPADVLISKRKQVKMRTQFLHLDSAVRSALLIPFVFSILFSLSGYGQMNLLETYGYKHVVVPYKNENIDVLVLSKKGEETKAKPLFLFCQGSLPVPLMVYEGDQMFPSFPFDTKELCDQYHLAIIGKPGVPLMADVKTLQPDLSYLDSKSNLPPVKYSQNNFMEYYVKRNLAVLDYFTQKNFVDKTKLVVSGHSQGARIAFEMALQSRLITHLIYASGNPCGQIMSMVAKTRQMENPRDSSSYAEKDFHFYEAIVADSTNSESRAGDNFKSIYSFSKSSLNDFPKLKIPVFVCYGTYDAVSPFNDLLRAELIRKRRKNVTFKPYVGLDHNYFGFTESGQIDYDNFNWDRVAKDWMMWLNTN